jgi:NADH-quinone oxidoreductase subunit J
VIQTVVFWLLSLLVIVPAILVVTLKNVLHAALFLILSLTGVAGLFALLGADFLFVVQILLYAGGIMVLVLFVIMLSGNPKDWIARQVNEQWLGGLLVSAVFVSLLATLFRLMPEAQAVAPAEPTTASLGILLLRDMVLPFDAISLVLLSALVGAILFSRRSER